MKQSKLIGVIWIHQTDSKHEVPGAIAWDSDNPLVLTVIFHELKYDAEWLIARDLFADALKDGQAGLGDVKAKCGMMADLDRTPWDTPAFMLDLTSPTGECTVATHLAPIISFLSDTYGIVPRGEEELDVDSFIRQLNL